MHETETECRERPQLELWSFGFKYGAIEGNLVTDVRFLPNPYYVPDLRHMTGKDEACAAYVFKDNSTGEFTSALTEAIIRMEKSFAVQDRKLLKIAIGCTGGQHRSVAVVESIARNLRETGLQPRVYHKELETTPH